MPRRQTHQGLKFPTENILTHTSHLESLAHIQWICYTECGRNERTTFTACTRKSPQVASWGDFLSLFCELGLRLRLVAFFSFVKPFADIVGDYASQDGEKEWKNNVFHSIYTSFPCQSGGGNGQSIASLYTKEKILKEAWEKNKNYIENMRIKQENPRGGELYTHRIYITQQRRCCIMGTVAKGCLGAVLGLIEVVN